MIHSMTQALVATAGSSRREKARPDHGITFSNPRVSDFSAVNVVEGKSQAGALANITSPMSAFLSILSFRNERILNSLIFFNKY